jgi:hypothetical protein
VYPHRDAATQIGRPVPVGVPAMNPLTLAHTLAKLEAVNEHEPLELVGHGVKDCTS